MPLSRPTVLQIMLGDSGTRVSINVLVQLSLGRGAQLVSNTVGIMYRCDVFTIETRLFVTSLWVHLSYFDQ